MSFRPKHSTLVVCSFIGLVILGIALYLLVTNTIFFGKAKPFNAVIVGVSYEYVPKGRGSVLAYVPIVEVQNGAGSNVKIKAFTWDERPVYHVGDKMQLLCEVSVSQTCIRNTFIDIWGNGLGAFILSLLFFSPLLYYKFIDKRKFKEMQREVL